MEHSLKRKICNIKCLLLNEENSQINDFSLYLNKLRKEQQIKPKERRKDLIALLQELFRQLERRGIPNSFCKPAVPCYQSQTNALQEETTD